MRLPLARTALIAIALVGCTKPPEAGITVLTEGPYATGDLITFDGRGSADLHKTPLPLTFDWRLVETPPGSASDLVRDDVPQVGFVADMYGDYVVGLVVSNGKTESLEATATVSIANCGNEAPIISTIDAAPASPNTGDLVRLSAAVADADVEAACGLAQDLVYEWSIATAPAGSEAELLHADTAAPSFVPDRSGDYAFQLVVTDTTGRATTNDFPLAVSACGDAAPAIDTVTTTPSAPHAEESVTLAVAVSDQDNQGTCTLAQDLAVTSWFVERPAGSATALWPEVGTTPAFVPDVPGDYIIRTQVDDGTGRATTIDTTVAVGTCGSAAPTIDDVNVVPSDAFTGDFVSFDVTASDLDNATTCNLGQTLLIDSRIVAAPPGSSTSLAPADGDTPGFLADVPGTYLVRSTVTDPTGRASSVTTSVSVDDCGSNAPTARLQFLVPPGQAGSAVYGGLFPVNTVVQLSAGPSSDEDALPPCLLNGDLSYRWELVDVPQGATSTLTNASVETPSFTPNVAGNYRGRVTVTDAEGHADVATFSIDATARFYNIANGWTLSFVAGGAPYFSSPKGITLDTNGRIYVAQSSGNTVTVTDPLTGATSWFAGGNEFNRGGSVEDIVYAPTVDRWFVSIEQRIIRVDALNAQSNFYNTGNTMRSLTVFTPSGSSTPRLQAANESQDRIDFIDLNSGAGAGNSGQFNNVGNLAGHDAAVIGNTNVYFLGDRSQNEVRRWTSSTDNRLTSAVFSPRDLVRAPSGNVYTTDSGNGMVYKITDCGGNNCPTQAIATGTWTPYGIAIEDVNTLLVTDNNGAVLYRLENPAGL